MTIKPELVPNWKVLYKSWTVVLSVFFGLVNLVFGGLYFLTPYFDPKTFAIINFVCYMLIGIARMLKQDNLVAYSPPAPMHYIQYMPPSEEEEIKFSQFDSPD